MNPKLLLLAPGIAATAQAAEIQVNVEIPRLNVAEYHRPYVAAWIESPDRKPTLNLAVWYDTEMKEGRGEKWLKDLRQWWRKVGRSSEMPMDGVSSPTKPAGKHDISTSSENLPPLAEGEYTLVVEAAREVGGRELVKIPFKWDGKTAVSISGKGNSELGEVTLNITTTTVSKETSNEPKS
ncbi:Hypothetical protein SAMN02745181_1426 [Rubritalea squalenifaciens DSM 18772]|uniref:DUF2271 domain-containing protein n=1 Tax=Rubritalea squalenifaciens DSM 18772 TaxID=1123071 RepID=A0A1M6HBK2_9BACT|nr:DUF2271 domain-containing protein [Rubritalea squalenifaciens]SHJ19523.1 Hypothetical protein SAMN02745181_1426 [Rubritalea squalenifaciens DSM 18772]